MILLRFMGAFILPALIANSLSEPASRFPSQRATPLPGCRGLAEGWWLLLSKVSDPGYRGGPGYLVPAVGRSDFERPAPPHRHRQRRTGQDPGRRRPDDPLGLWRFPSARRWPPRWR